MFTEGSCTRRVSRSSFCQARHPKCLHRFWNPKTL